MPDYRAVAKKAALKYGIDPYIFIRQIKAESGFDPHSGSPAGAIGIAQFMPGTAKGLGIDPYDPVESLYGAAKLMASYKRKFKTYRNALIAYNAGPGRVGKPLFGETADYINKILINGEPKGGGMHVRQASAPAAAGGGVDLNLPAATQQPVQPTITAPPTPAFDGRQYLAMPQGAQQLQLPSTPPKVPEDPQQIGISAPPAGTPAAATPAAPAAPAATSTKGKLIVASGANRAGVGLRKPIVGLLEKASGYYGKPITVTTGTNHNRMTTTGNVSDHWDGNAGDMGVNGDARQSAKARRTGDAIAASIFMAAGVSEKRAWAMARRGGVFNIQYRGRRLQVLWKTLVGGDHYNHVHAGYR